MKNNAELLFYFLTTILIVTSSILQGQDYVDIDFGDNGSTPLIYTEETGDIQPEVTSFDSLGNIYISFKSSSTAQIALVKVQPNGQLDSTFGQNGVLDSLPSICLLYTSPSPRDS